MSDGFEARCPEKCDKHTSDFADFDHYCDDAKIQPGEEPMAFAAWLNTMARCWDGEAIEIEGATDE